MQLHFKQWMEALDKEQPPSAGDLKDNQSNADDYGIPGARSKNFGMGRRRDITVPSPEKMFGKKRVK
jgi:site-specific DNA-cytosine methylase